MPAYVRKMLESAAMAHPPSPHASLRERFLAWYNDLPAVARDRAFSMLEFERALRTQGRHLSPILLSLGWKRRRRWASGGGQYNRFWVPPTRPA
jgi:hypothetical protein